MTDVNYWIDIFEKIPAEWLVVIGALFASWIITEIVKRNVVWKKRGNKPLTKSVTIGQFQVSLKIPYVISFFVALAVCLIFWPKTSSINGYVEIGSLGAIIGAASPAIYSFTMWALVKAGMPGLAKMLNGDRRLKDRN
jgi:uncharacterized Tic20 family protein